MKLPFGDVIFRLANVIIKRLPKKIVMLPVFDILRYIHFATYNYRRFSHFRSWSIPQ